MSQVLTRRSFLTMAGLAGAADLLSPRCGWADEPALETTTVRLGKTPIICFAPQYVCEALLRADGFTDIRYVETTVGTQQEDLGRGKFDFHSNLAIDHAIAIDQGLPISVLTGLHAGCYELFAREGVGSITELKGKQVGVQAGSPALLRLMAAHVGLNPEKDFQWVIDPEIKPLDLFAEGKIDAFLAFPPEPQELRDRYAGHVILDTTVDRPWSQYFCCMVAANREYARRHPVATKRALRAIFNAANLCVSDPPAVARKLVDAGVTRQYDHALQTVSEIRYDKWRDYDAEDTVRFYVLRLHEVGMIKSLPNKLITDNTDWRFLNELKRELKA